MESSVIKKEWGSGEIFDYPLRGKVIKGACRDDLFEAFLHDLDWLKSQLREMIENIDRCIAKDVKEYKRVAARHGRVVIIRDADLNPVDVFLLAKEARS